MCWKKKQKTKKEIEKDLGYNEEKRGNEMYLSSLNTRGDVGCGMLMVIVGCQPNLLLLFPLLLLLLLSFHSYLTHWSSH